MWTARSEELTDARGMRLSFANDSHPTGFADVIRALRSDAEFRAMLNGLLADAPFAAFRWETPAVTSATVARPFECVLLDSPELERKPDRDGFAEHFASSKEDVISFANLGRDAILVVPCPLAGPAAYGHLASFVRLAPERQRDALWRSVGDVVDWRLGTKPVWLSTAGAGISWLHVRLDDRPKYYAYGPYRRVPAAESAPGGRASSQGM